MHDAARAHAARARLITGLFFGNKSVRTMSGGILVMEASFSKSSFFGGKGLFLDSKSFNTKGFAQGRAVV
jgi:hypothetical protein